MPREEGWGYPDSPRKEAPERGKEWPQKEKHQKEYPKENPLPTSGPIPEIIDDIGDIEDELEEIKAALYCSLDKVAAGTIINPQAVYTSRPQIPLLRADGDLIITRIHIVCSDSSPTTELAGDLKYADDMNTGSFTGATVIDVCDTTNGVFTAVDGFDNDSVPSGKYIYFQMDSSPHADIKDFYIEVYYT